MSWNDKDDRYRGKIEYVEDRAGIERYGYRELEVRAMGCTSQGQAQRVGRWALLTNMNETETVTFKVAAEGFFLMPGEIIEIKDPYKAFEEDIDNVPARKYRVIALNEDDQLVTVLASAYDENKYNIVDDSTLLSSEITSIAGLTVTPAVNGGSIVLRTT